MRALILLFGLLINFNVLSNTQNIEEQAAITVDYINTGEDVDMYAGAMSWASPTEGITSEAISTHYPKESRETRAIIFLVISAGLAAAIFIYRKSSSAYGKSKEIYSNIKDVAEQKRVARLVEDEALKVQVRKEMQSAPTTTESILKEQISEALNRGDSKLATELLELFKLSQENNK